MVMIHTHGVHHMLQVQNPNTSHGGFKVLTFEWRQYTVYDI